MTVRIGHLVVGEQRHGVVRFAEGVLSGLPAGGTVVRACTVADLTAEPEWAAPLAGAALVHLHYTDRLFGAHCVESARTFTDIADHLRHRIGTPSSVTLHDLPQPGDGAARYRRRAACYRSVVEAASGVVVCSEHEAALLNGLGAAPRPRAVIPLPIDHPPGPAPQRRGDGQVTVLGFLHPGKGHAGALQAMRGLPPAVGMVALGRCADGHGHLEPELAAAARASGRTLQITGFVDGAELPGRLHRAGVPLAPNEVVSASASISTWLTAGRRPLVPAGSYTREVEHRCPGALWTYRPGELPHALARALAEPGLTWLDPAVRLGPSTPAVSVAYARALARFAGG